MRLRITSGAARIQPIRIPAQIDLLTEPTVMTAEPPGSKAAIGRGISSPGEPVLGVPVAPGGPSGTSVMVSSAISTVPEARAAATSSRRCSVPASALRWGCGSRR